MKTLFLLVMLNIVVSPAWANQEIIRVLDQFHQAAADADMQAYLALMTPDSVFLGTDASERWTKKQFKAFVEPYFSKGNGWLYQPEKRNITLAGNAEIAFFDELLSNENYGLCRGSGVLLKTISGWKIAQYNLSIPIPNAIAGSIVKQINAKELHHEK